MLLRTPTIAHAMLIILVSIFQAQPAQAQVGNPAGVGCINSATGVEPVIGVLGMFNTIPVNLDLGIATTILLGTGEGVGGGLSLIDSTFNINVPDNCSITAGALVVGYWENEYSEWRQSGPTTRLTLNGPFNRLEVGGAGLGLMEILNGSVVDAAIDPQNCPQEICNNYVTNSAGARGDLLIDGAGSRLDTLNSFVIAAGNVEHVQFGGLFTSATVTVTRGGVLNTQWATVSQGPGGSIPRGTEETDAIVEISGTGSQWNSTNITVANHPNATALVRVCDGAEITVVDFLDVFAGGTLMSNSTINGVVNIVGGIYEPGCSIGTSTINGDLNFESGEWIVEANSATEFDVVDVSGQAVISDVTLRFKFANGFAPSAGQVLSFLQSPSLAGTNNITVETENLLPGFQFDVQNGQLIAINDGTVASVSPQMDIRPGTDTNKVHPRFGLVPVAVLTTDDLPIFDATEIKASSVRFGPKKARPIGNHGIKIDVDHDGDHDTVFLFFSRSTGITCGDTSAMLSARTNSGTQLTSTDAIETVGCH